MSPASTAPALAGRCDAEMIDRHVLGHREAIMRFDAVDLLDAGNASTTEGRVDRQCQGTMTLR
jgi:hypothetical protein